MPLMKLRLIPIRINERRHKPPRIGNHKLQRRSSSPLIMSRRIIRIPNQHTRNTSIHARSHQKRHPILHLWMLDADISYHGVADDGGEQGDEHDDAAEFEAVGDEGDEDGHYGGGGVGDYAEELGAVGGVA